MTAKLIAAVRRVVNTRTDWAQTAQLVAAQLREHLPAPEVVTTSVGRYLHAEADGTFSIVSLVLRPGHSTRIHDHVTWCVVGVLQGIEHEEIYDAQLNVVDKRRNHAGEVSGFAPPGDIHRISNFGEGPAVSLHIYGTDITRVGSSVRRYYD